jgi:hypothetical protein
MERDMQKIRFLSGPTVRLDLDADDWRLYNADTPEKDQERDFAAMEINEELALAIAEAPTRDAFRGYGIFGLHKNWGATDTATREVLETVLEKVYGN